VLGVYKDMIFFTNKVNPMKAYDVFGNAANEKALKVILTN
jgi:hypothetical protein